jgi:hypothetical protein
VFENGTQWSFYLIDLYKFGNSMSWDGFRQGAVYFVCRSSLVSLCPSWVHAICLGSEFTDGKGTMTKRHPF